MTDLRAETIPMPVQRPRPPLTIAAHGPKMLRIAAPREDDVFDEVTGSLIPELRRGRPSLDDSPGTAVQ